MISNKYPTHRDIIQETESKGKTPEGEMKTSKMSPNGGKEELRTNEWRRLDDQFKADLGCTCSPSVNKTISSKPLPFQ